MEFTRGVYFISAGLLAEVLPFVGVWRNVYTCVNSKRVAVNKLGLTFYPAALLNLTLRNKKIRYRLHCYNNRLERIDDNKVLLINAMYSVCV